MNLHNLYSLAALGLDLASHKFLKTSKNSVLIWSLSNRCNLDCSYCGLPNLKTEKEDLYGDQLISYLDLAIENGLKIISITGGEPMLHPDFERFVRHCYENNVLVSVNTNGILVKKKINFLKDYCYQVVISIDGPEHIHDLHRGKGSFDVARNAIKILNKECVKTHATCVITNDNINELSSILDFAKRNKIKIGIQPVTDLKLSGEDCSSSLSNSSKIKLVDALIEHKKSKNNVISNSLGSLKYWKELFITPNKVNCKAGKIFARISHNGDLNRCGRVQNDVIKYREVLSNGMAESFESLTNSPQCISCNAWSAIKINTLF